MKYASFLLVFLLPLVTFAQRNTSEASEQAFRAEPPEPGPAPEIELGDFEEFTLDNGLQVVVVENHKLPRVSYQLFVDVPPHMEGAYAGAQGLLGQMLRRATDEMTKEEIDEAVDFIGASLSTSGSGAYASTISKYKEEVIELMADVVLNARFPEEEFAKVKQEAAAGLAQQISDPNSIASRLRQRLVFGENHPYGELTTEASLDSITLDVVEQVYDRYFVPNRSYLVMVGDLTEAEARRLAEDNFGSWDRKEVMTPDFDTPAPPEGVRVSFVPRPGAVQSNVIIATPAKIEPGTKEAIRASLLNQVLGSGFNGRLFANLREDKGYTYGAYSSVNDDPVIGEFRAYASVRNEVTDSAVTEFMNELRKIASEPVTEQELRNVKMQTTGSFGRALESPQRIASFALNTLRYDLDRDFYPEYLQTMQATSANDLHEVAEDIIDPENMHIIVVGDRAVAEKLARFATDGEVDFYDVNAEPVDMSSMDAPTDLTPETVLNGFFEAIGGKEQAEAIQNVTLTLTGNIQGQEMTQTMTTTNDGRMASTTSMMGMTLAEQRYNQGKASVKQQGNEVPLPPEAVESMGMQAVIFPEFTYLDMLDNITIEGQETVNGQQAVVLAIETSSGTMREYYDAASMLKLRTVRNQGGQTITQNLSDYEPTPEGVQFPRTMALEGVAPFPIELKVAEIEIDGELDDAMFEIE